MLRSQFALRLVILGVLVGPSLAMGQEPAKPDEPAKPANPVVAPTTPLPADSTQKAPATPRNANGTVTRRRVDPAPAPNLRFSLMRPMNAPRGPDPLEANFGLSLAAPDETLRSQLAIPAGEGVVIVGVKPGSLTEQSGLKVNDVLLALGNQPIKGLSEARNTILAVSKAPLQVKMIRAGKPRELALVGPEHGAGVETTEYWIGVPVTPVDVTLRSHLISLPPDTGLVANDVVADSPAAKAGLKKSDVLITLGGKPLKSTEELIKQIQVSEGKPVALEILRGGKPETITVTPGKRASTRADVPVAIPANLGLTDPFFLYYADYAPKAGVIPLPPTVTVYADAKAITSELVNSGVNDSNASGLPAVGLTIAREILNSKVPENHADVSKTPIRLDLVRTIDFSQTGAAWAEALKDMEVIIESTERDTALKEIKDSLDALRKSVEAIEKAVKK